MPHNVAPRGMMPSLLSADARHVVRRLPRHSPVPSRRTSPPIG